MSPSFGEPASLSGAETLTRVMSWPLLQGSISAICVRQYCWNAIRFSYVRYMGDCWLQIIARIDEVLATTDKK
jgi:hypothetical protein